MVSGLIPASTAGSVLARELAVGPATAKVRDLFGHPDPERLGKTLHRAFDAVPVDQSEVSLVHYASHMKEAACLPMILVISDGPGRETRHFVFV